MPKENNRHQSSLPDIPNSAKFFQLHPISLSSFNHLTPHQFYQWNLLGLLISLTRKLRFGTCLQATSCIKFHILEILVCPCLFFQWNFLEPLIKDLVKYLPYHIFQYNNNSLILEFNFLLQVVGAKSMCVIDLHHMQIWLLIWFVF